MLRDGNNLFEKSTLHKFVFKIDNRENANPINTIPSLFQKDWFEEERGKN